MNLFRDKNKFTWHEASSMNNFDIVRKFPTASLCTVATNKVLTST